MRIPAVLMAVAALLPVLGYVILGRAYIPASPAVLIGSTLVQLAVSVVIVALGGRAVPLCAVIAVAACAFVLTSGFTYPVDNVTVPWIPIAAGVAAASLRTGHGHLAPSILAVGSILLLQPWQGSWNTVVQGISLFAAPTLAGLYLTTRRMVVTQLRDQVDAAYRELHLLGIQARAEERARLAEEMHDVITHRVSLMVLQAGALRITAADDTTRAAAEELRTAGVQALDELRDLVGILRTPVGRPLAASPTLPDLADLVSRSCVAGLNIDFSRTGEDHSAPVVARTVYRIVQEALANVGKHAPAAAATVTVTYGPGDVRVRVVSGTDTPPDADLAATGSGQGLSSLARRVDLMSGAFQAGPDGDGRFVVEAHLPAYVPAGA